MEQNKYRIIFREKIGLTTKERNVILSAVNNTEAVILLKKEFEVKKVISVTCIEDCTVKQSKLF
ncbi:MAG: hypothetical protein JXR68_06760 [Bacteroidales bacterium]|nr:hypothetical protein [Bacteroidales bacterium]